MALTINELNTVSDKYYDPTIPQQVYEDSAFTAILQSKNKIIKKGGESIQFGVRYQKLGTSGKTGFRTKVDFSSKQTRTGAVLSWMPMQGYTMMHWDEKVKNRGKSAIIDLQKDKAVELKEDFQDALSSILWGTETDSIAPLAQIVDSADTYAGITVSDVAAWAAIEDSSSTVLTLSLLMSLRNQATFGKHKPTHHFTTLDLASRYELMLEPKERYYDKDMANLGFDTVTFYGKPVIGDEYVSSGDWYGLDMTVFELLVQEGNDMNITPWFSLEQAGFPNAIAKYMSSVMNLVCHIRKSNFKLTALDADL